MMTMVVAVAACGTPPPDEEALRRAEQERSELQTKDLVKGLQVARTALEIAGVLPSYTCGPVDDSIGKAIPPLSVPLACMTLSTREGGMDLEFEKGCELATHRLEGTLAFELETGDDRIDVTADLRGLAVDGKTLPVRIGAGVCGDEKRVWATVEPVAVRNALFALDVRAGYRKGLPIIGSDEVVLDGTGSLSGDHVAAEELEYEIGAPMPKKGSLTVNRADGTGFTVRFTEVLWKLGKAELTVNGREPVEVYVVN